MEDFIRGVLMNEEFLDSRIYWEPLISPTYALPITSWNSYQILCRDILQRQSYPLVPDTLPLSLRNFIYMSRSMYKHRSATLSKGCTLHNESIVGENSTLGKNSFIKRSVIGPQCTIGNNVSIVNSHIISNTVIEDDCNIIDSIILSNCIIKKNVKLNSCMLLLDVTCTEDFEKMFIEISDSNLVSREIEEDLDTCNYNHLTILDREVDKDDDGDASSTSSHSSTWSSSSSLRDTPPPVQLEDHEIFSIEVTDSLLRGYQDQLKCENLILEINSSRYAYNVGIRQVSYSVIKAILSLPLQLTQLPDNYRRTLKTMLTYFKPIIANYIKTENAQEDCLRAIQDVACSNQQLILPCTQYLLHFFYDNDILFEEKIIEWYEQDCNDNQDAGDYLNNAADENIAKALKNSVLPFVQWLKEAEEDSSNSS